MNSVRKLVVAVVDDDRRVLESLDDLLESGGYCARVFPSAKDFLESGALLSISCLISDIRMPAMDGWELEMLARHERPELPIILITGHDAIQNQARSTRAAGRLRVLFKKPFDGQELLAAISAALAAPPNAG